MSASITARSPLLVVLYEGAGAHAARRRGRASTIMRALLEKGYRVITTRAGRSGADAGRAAGARPRPLHRTSRRRGRRRHRRRGPLPRRRRRRRRRTSSRWSKASAATPQTQKPGGWKPWFPVIDYSRCTNCMQCLSLLPVRRLRRVARTSKIEVQNQTNCKTDCPACSRVCPEVAILFPKYKAGPINGDEVNADDLQPREDEGRHLGAARRRHLRRAARAQRSTPSSRFAKERDEKRALEERKKCLAKLQAALDIPPEVMNALPTADQIQPKARGARPASEEPRIEAERAAHDRSASAHAHAHRAPIRGCCGSSAGTSATRACARCSASRSASSKGEYFPPFLYISIINSCNLRCQGCWVKVDGPRKMIDLRQAGPR